MTFQEVFWLGKEKEKAFQDYILLRDLKSIQIMCAFFMLSQSAFLLLDINRASHFEFVLYGRLVFIVCLVGLLIAIRKKGISSSNIQYVMSLFSLVLIIEVIILDSWGGIPPFTGVNMFVTAMFSNISIIGMRFRFSSVMNLFLFVFLLIYVRFSPNREFLFSQLPNVFQMMVISNVIGYILERNRKQNFLAEIHTQALVAQRQKVISLLSHDLASPLNSLSGLISIKQLVSPEDVNAHLSTIKNAVQSNKLLLQSLVKWSKSQMDGFVPNYKKVLLKKIVAEVMTNLDLGAKNLVLIETYVDHQIVVTDEEMLKVILRNVISNAIKYSSQGGKIEIGYHEGNHQFTIAIRDWGVGMSEEKISRLFAGVNHSLIGTSAETGTGIGLMIVKELVEKLGGKITATSKMEEGTTVSMTFDKV